MGIIYRYSSVSVSYTHLNLNEIERLKEMDITDASAWLHLGWEGAGSANRQDPALQAKHIGYALSAVRTAGALGCSRFLFSGSQGIAIRCFPGFKVPKR